MPDYLVDPQERGFGPPNMAAQLFGMISSLPNAYQQGAENKFKRGQFERTEKLQEPILGPDGKPTMDPNVILPSLVASGGGEYAKEMFPYIQKQPVFNMAIKQMQEEQNGGGGPPYSPSNPNISPDNQTPRWLHPQGQRSEAEPRAAPTAEDWDKFSAGGPANEVLSDHRGPLNVRQLAADAGLDPNNEVLKNEFKGYGLDRSITRGTAPGIFNKFQNLKNAGLFGPAEPPDATGGLGPAGGQGTMYMPGPGMQGAPQAGPGGQPGQQPVQMAQASQAQPQPQQSQGGFDPAAGLVPPSFRGGDSRAFAEVARAQANRLRGQGDIRGMVGIPSKSKEDAAAELSRKADAIDAAWAKSSEMTTQEKEFRAGAKPGENLSEFQARQAGEKAAALKEQTDAGAMMQKLQEGGLDAIGHKAMLDTVQKLGEKVPYGIIPKIQSELGRFGIETKGLSDIQAYERAIDYMAPQLRPIGSGRLMQQELAAFKSSLGGLMTTPEGRQISVENLKLLANYKESVGRIAADSSVPIRDRLAKIYALEPPHLKTLADGGGNDGGGKKQEGFSGRTATNPKTGEKLRETANGQWVP